MNLRMWKSPWLELLVGLLPRLFCIKGRYPAWAGNCKRVITLALIWPTRFRALPRGRVHCLLRGDLSNVDLRTSPYPANIAGRSVPFPKRNITPMIKLKTAVSDETAA